MDLNNIGLLGAMILANNGRTPYNQGLIGNSLAQYMQGMQQQKEWERDKQLYDLKMQQVQNQMSDSQMARDRQAQQQQYLNTYISSLPQKDQAKFRAFPEQAAKHMFALPGLTDDIREYNFAKQQGYTGSLENWIINQGKARASTVKVGENHADKYVPTGEMGNFRRFNAEANQYEYPSTPMTYGEMAKSNYRFVPSHELTQERDNEKILKETNANIENFRGQIGKYRDTLSKYGTQLLPGNEQMLLESDYTSMQMAAKEYLKLGVLAGPDLDLMKAMAADPTSLITNYIARDGDLSGLLGQLESIEKSLDATKNVYQSIYGREASLTPQEKAELEELRKEKSMGGF